MFSSELSAIVPPTPHIHRGPANCCRIVIFSLLPPPPVLYFSHFTAIEAVHSNGGQREGLCHWQPAARASVRENHPIFVLAFRSKGSQQRRPTGFERSLG